MSIPHRYQSHFFQTVQTQVRQLKDTAQLRWRQFRIVAAWGAQLSLYPLYRIFQAARWGGRVLEAQAARGAQRLRAVLGINKAAPLIDQPIRNVLALLKLQSNAIQASEQLTWQVDLVPIPAPKPVWQTCIDSLRALRQVWSTRQLQYIPANPRRVLLASQPALTPAIASESLWQNKIAPVQHLLWHIWCALPRPRRTAQPFKLLTSQRRPAPDPMSQTLWQKGMALKRRWQETWLRHATAPLPTAPTTTVLPHIQGIASSLVQRHLVLVAANNQVLDILNLEQQQKLHQRIIWEIAIARRTQHRFQFLRPLRLAPQRLLALPTTVCRALVASLGAIALLPFTLALPQPVQAATPAMPLPLPYSLPGEWLMDPVRSRKRSQTETELSGPTSHPSAGTVRVPAYKAPAALQAGTTFEGRIADWFRQSTPATNAEGSSAIEVDAVFLGYQQHVLERLLCGLDQGIAWLEPRALAIWQRWWPVVRQGMRLGITQCMNLSAVAWTWFWQYGWPVLRQWLRTLLTVLLDWLKLQLPRVWRWVWPRLKQWVQQALT